MRLAELVDRLLLQAAVPLACWLQRAGTVLRPLRELLAPVRPEDALEAERDRIKQQILDIRCGWEYAFANGARSAGADNPPEVRRVLEQEGDLLAQLAELDGWP